MFRKLVSLTLAALFVSAVAFAGDGHDHGKAAAAMPDMDVMMKQMQNCMVCKNMAPHMAELMPAMKMERVALNNGFAMMTTISDPKLLATYHSTCDLMTDAGAKAMALSMEDSKTMLCDFCQGIYNFSHAGGNFSVGKTPTGDMMVFASDNPENKEKLVAMEKMCEMMAAN